MKRPTALLKNASQKTTIFSKTLYLLFFLYLFCISINAQQLAFPTAKGGGAYITGGRGGQVVKVTNLSGTSTKAEVDALKQWRNSDGASGTAPVPGSFVAAMFVKGTKTIVFEVGGTIVLNGWAAFSEMCIGSEFDNITIAGQTAPGGITIECDNFQLDDVDNVIIRYVRFKALEDTTSPGATDDNPDTYRYLRDGITFQNSGSEIIFDHLSVLNGQDEGIDIQNNNAAVRDVTVQKTLIGNCKTGVLMSGGGAGEKWSFINNVITNTSHRFPNLSANQGEFGQWDVINNVVYNSLQRYITVAGPVETTNGFSELNNINNYYYTSSHLVNTYGDYYKDNANQMRTVRVGPEDIQIYTDGNLIKGWTSVINNVDTGLPMGPFDPAVSNDRAQWTNFNYNAPGEDAGRYVISDDYFVSPHEMFPLVGEPFTIKTAQETYDDVAANLDIGANSYLDDNHNKTTYLEAADASELNSMLNDSATEFGGHSYNRDIYGTHTGFTRPSNWDTDGDGMPNTWETANGFNPNVADNNGDADGDGYTNLEEYLNIVDGDVVTIDVTGVVVTPETATINIPDTVTLTASFEPSNATNQSGTWSSSNVDIATVNASGVVTPISEGEVTITFNTNSGGFSDSATITVTNIPIDVESVSLSPETLELNINATASLTADILPANATDLTGVWSTADSNIATVDQEGLVQPIAVGETTITFITNDGGLSASSTVIINDDKFGTYEFYNADTDNLIQPVEGGEVFNLDNVGDNLNFRIIPYGGDDNPEVESVGIQWDGAEDGNYAENAPLYSGMTGHIGDDYWPYTVQEGTYNFTVTYYSENGQVGDVVAVDNFSINFTRGSQVNAGEDTSICDGETVTLTATGADSYLWDTGETTASIAVSPDATTEYTVTGTHTNGTLTTTDSVVVTVNQLPVISAGEDQTICEGDTVTLTATTSVGSITWSNGQTTSSITVSPSETTTYVATANNNGCLSTDEVTINVNPAPIADAGNDITILLGNSAILTASGGDSYLWSNGETTESVTVSPTSNTTYSVDVFNSNNCSNTDTVTVTVVGPVVANAGEDIAICEGESVTLTASGGDSYLWNTGETTQSITISPLNTTTYSVTVSDQFSTDSDEVIVTVNPAPIVNAGDDVTINEGENVTLYASGGNTYLWSTGETNANISVSPSETTTYSVTTTINGCSDTDEVTVTVIQLVNAFAGDDQSICLGAEIILTASGGDSYEWSNGETTESITVTPQTTTTYSVTVTNANGSDTDDVTVNVENCPAQDFEYRAYPNPTNGIVNVKLAGLNTVSIIQVTDILGKQLKYIEVQPNSGQTINLQVDLTGMTKGFYLMTFYGDNRTITKKMVLR